MPCYPHSPRNIMLGVIDDTIFKQFEKAELNLPSPRKELEDGRIIYVSRPLEMPETPGLPVLCDFGSAAWGEETHTGNVQPKLYRSPEIWDLFEGGHLFDARDPEHDAYRTRAHLCEMITLMGPPPPEFLARSTLRSKFFTEQGEFINAGLEVLPRMSLAEVETTLEAENDTSRHSERIARGQVVKE
ncbi:hypothetical protein H0H93_000695 [Arthromyces matolae]|nr:hypothetical protein H0H93_000695 [Arthromyces matolae]